MKRSVSKRALAWGVLLVLPISLAFIFVPKVAQYQDISANKDVVEAQIARLTTVIQAPVAPRQSERYRSLVHATDTGILDVETELRGSVLRVLELVQARLIEISTSHAQSNPGAFSEVKCRLTLEGGTQNLAEFLTKIGDQSMPILVESLSVSATSSIGEPERQLRASVVLVIHIQSVEAT